MIYIIRKQILKAQEVFDMVTDTSEKYERRKFQCQWPNCEAQVNDIQYHLEAVHKSKKHWTVLWPDYHEERRQQRKGMKPVC